MMNTIQKEKRFIMSSPYGFLDVCYAQCQQAKRIKLMPHLHTPRILLEYSMLRLSKIGCAGKKNVEAWQELFEDTLKNISRIEPEVPFRGECTRMAWPFHPGLAWLGARDKDAELIAQMDQAAEELCEKAHRNEKGLFDDPLIPGGLFTEILAMTVPFLAWAGKSTGKSRYTEEAVFQMKGYMEMLYDPGTRLWHPGFIPGPSDKSMWLWWQGSNQVSHICRTAVHPVGVFPGYWGKGAGYALFALSELVFELEESNPAKAGLLSAREEMLASLLQYQDENGVFHQVLNEFSSYEETSGSAWILYAMGRAIKRGSVDRARFMAPYRKGLAGIARYLTFDGSILNGSPSQICPGGRATAVDYALLKSGRNEPGAFAPVLLALQQAAQIRNHTDLMKDDWSEIIENNGGIAQ